MTSYRRNSIYPWLKLRQLVDKFPNFHHSLDIDKVASILHLLHGAKATVADRLKKPRYAFNLDMHHVRVLKTHLFVTYTGQFLVFDHHPNPKR